MTIVVEGGIAIGPGISIGSTATPPALNPVLSLDAGNPASYPGTGATWTDTIGSIPFTLVNSPTYNSANGGYLQFDPNNSQYGYSTTNLGTLANWSIEAWHYYDGTNSSSGPNIFTEYSYGGGTINLGLGCGGGGDTDLQAWWYGPGFQATDPYTLTPGYWYQIVGTFNGTNLKLYVNNILVETANKPPGGDANPGIGYGLMTRWDPGGLWGGRLAILNVYDTDIGASGVTQIWNTNKSRFNLATPGEQEYTTPGTYSWTAPADVTSVSVVAVGAGGGGIKFSTGDQLGGGGAGGGLGWKNNIAVTPGQTYTVVVGAGGTSTISGAGTATDGGNSYFINTSTVAGFGGEHNKEGSVNVAQGGGYAGDGGGTGGNAYSCSNAGGGGGAGGYSGAGGLGAVNTGSLTGQTGSGGAGGGGGTTIGSNIYGGAGGGVSIYGQGADGAGGTSGGAGDPGSNGSAKTYGGGANGSGSDVGGSGAVRIIWGSGREFPSTNTADV